MFEDRSAFDGLHVDEHRVQGKCAAGTVRTRLGAGIVYRQKLNDIESAELGPLGERNQVQEFANANAVLAVKTEKGNGYAGLKGS